MASTLVRSALYSIIEDDTYIMSNKMKNVKAQAKSILEEIVKDKNEDTFNDFAILLHGRLEQLVFSQMPLISAHARQSLWEGYYKVRVVELTELWGKLSTDLDIVNWDVMLVQMANDKLIEELIKFHTTTVDHEQQKKTKAELPILEQNII